MINTRKFAGSVLPFVVLGALMVPGAACDKAKEAAEGAQSGLCCSDFKVGADMTGVDFGADANFNLFMQATGDLSAAATATIDDVTNACKAIAVDLGEEETAVTEKEPGAKATAWCNLAVGKIKSEITAKGSITIVAQPPMCSVSASAQANCEANCTVDATCQAELGDISARCDPGKISGKCSASCTGSCEGSANLAVSCEGECSGKCDGTCGGTCEGKCDGQDTKGSCSGRCEGTCTGGSCEGKCSGSCKMDANANVTCEGDCTGGCSVEYKAPKCTAELTPPKAECNANADCTGSCQASASAKAECRPGSLVITATGSIDAQAIASLQLNLPKLLVVFQARGKLLLDNAQAVVSIGANIDPGSFSAKAGICLIPAVIAIADAADNIKASFEASGKVAGELKIGQ